MKLLNPSLFQSIKFRAYSQILELGWYVELNLGSLYGQCLSQTLDVTLTSIEPNKSIGAQGRQEKAWEKNYNRGKEEPYKS